MPDLDLDDDELARLEPAALLARAQTGGGEHQRLAALLAWTERVPGGGEANLRPVLADPAAPSALRRAAARNLARRAGLKAEQALLDALGDADAALAATLVDELGRIGGRAAWAALSRRRPAFARTLISYRLGLGEALLDPAHAPRPAALDRAAATPLDGRPMARGQAFKSLLAGVTLGPPLHLRCGRAETVICAAAGAAGLGERNAVAAIVFQRSDSSYGFDEALLVLGHPAGRGSCALFAARPDGATTHAGEGAIRDGGLRFTLHALEGSRFPAMEMDGELRFADSRLTVTSALIGKPAPLLGTAPPRLAVALPPRR